jgi:outer membrane protein assembly factor BamB
MKPFKISFFFFLLALTASVGIQPVKSQQINWTHFRGTNLNGISEDQNVPTIWNDSTNVIWKTGIQGKGWSSPVVFGNQVWVTSASEDGKQMAGICLDFNSGKLIYNINLFQPDIAYPKHSINTAHALH